MQKTQNLIKSTPELFSNWQSVSFPSLPKLITRAAASRRLRGVSSSLQLGLDFLRAPRRRAHATCLRHEASGARGSEKRGRVGKGGARGWTPPDATLALGFEQMLHVAAASGKAEPSRPRPRKGRPGLGCGGRAAAAGSRTAEMWRGRRTARAGPSHVTGGAVTRHRRGRHMLQAAPSRYRRCSHITGGAVTCYRWRCHVTGGAVTCYRRCRHMLQAVPSHAAGHGRPVSS